MCPSMQNPIPDPSHQTLPFRHECPFVATPTLALNPLKLLELLPAGLLSN